jgi:hypothetical protein
MIIKLIGYGFKPYCRDKFNLFDGFIVLVSSVEVILSYAPIESGGNYFFILFLDFLYF